MIDEKYDIAIRELSKALESLGYENLQMTRINGTSMEPTLRDGAFVWHVPTGKTFVDSGIYIFNHPIYGSIIKRIVRAEHGIFAVSDNSSCPPIPIVDNIFDMPNFRKVIWVLQKF